MLTTPAANYEYDVFISYSHHDKAWVRGELLPRLESAGLNVCIDYRDFRLGAPSVSEMERAAVTSRKTLLILTPYYLASDWATFEQIMLQTLDPVNRTLRVIPILRTDVELPPRIGSMTYIDFTDSADDLAFTWTRLLDALGASASDTHSLQIFLCHDHHNEPSVRGLYNRLRNDGFQPWMKELDILPGQDAEQETQRAVHRADAMIVCLSNKSTDAEDRLVPDIEFVLNMAHQRSEKSIYRVPLRLEECHIPDQLQRLKPVNLFKTGGYEQLVLALRKVAAGKGGKQDTRFLTPPGFSWGGGIETAWFVLTDEYLFVQSSGESKTYEYAALAGVEIIPGTNEVDAGGFTVGLNKEPTISPDQQVLALTVSTGFTSFMRRMDDDFWDGGRSLLFIFVNGGIEPRFVTTNEWYVYGGPTFSPDGRHIAFAYSHNWRPYDSGDPLNPYVDWDDSIAIIDMQTWECSTILTRQGGPGYARWAEPRQFSTLTFVSDNVLFSHDWTYKGGEPSQAWNIPLDGGEPIVVENPFSRG